MQKMMTKAIERRTPKLYETDGAGGNAIAQAHYFTSACDWYMTEYDARTGDAFGMMKSADSYGWELGYFNVREFEAFNESLGQRVRRGGRFDLVERDLYFTPMSLGDIQMRA